MIPRITHFGADTHTVFQQQGQSPQGRAPPPSQRSAPARPARRAPLAWEVA